MVKVVKVIRLELTTIVITRMFTNIENPGKLIRIDNALNTKHTKRKTSIAFWSRE